MRLTRVFVDAPLQTDAALPLPSGPARHLVRVLRGGPGDALTVFNGQGGEFAAIVESVKRDAVTVRIGAHVAIERESPLATTLLQAIARGDKMDHILQKATELGVTRVIPVMSARSNVRLDALAIARKQEHWQAVVIAACEQCGRNRIPEVAQPLALPAALQATTSDLKLLLAPDAGATPLPAKMPRSIALLVGPEGGLDQLEVDAARRLGFVASQLGPRVLRTETAALAALAALQFAAGDLQ
jgi:16S rRNA (uracil1498-N3)-methyltransferase